MGLNDFAGGTLMLFYFLAVVQLAFGIGAGIYISGGSQDEHVTVAIMLIVALILSLLVLFSGTILNVFALYFIWLISMVAVSESIKFYQSKR